MDWSRIPAELKLLPQWVVAESDKRPRHPLTGRAASVNDPSTWGTYEEATSAGHPFIGFMLSKDDPYAFIDLDAPTSEDEIARHGLILKRFAGTYAEYSQSGKGIHIICRGAIPHGVRRDHVEVYSAERYMICTGNVFHDAPIADYQDLLMQLYREASPNGNGAYPALQDVRSDLTDREVIETAMNASNAEKFNKLCNGEWQGDYPSQSEADLGLLSMFAFYTPDNEQVARLFLSSRLGKRQKALRKDYIPRALSRIRAQEPMRADFSQFNFTPHPSVNGQETNAPPYGAAGSTNGAPEGTEGGVIPIPNRRHHTRYVPDSPLDFPPGLPGDVARYIFASSIRPVREISIAAGLGLIAGIAGRQFNINRTGLNLYLIVLAHTGRGKEEMASGIDRILSTVRQTVPMIDQFRGPATFSSGQSIIRALDDRPCMISVAGEIGFRLQELNDSHMSSNLAMKRVLLDLFMKSGQGQVLAPTVYSDQTKNTKMIASPALTWLGESTPDTFYKALSPQMIAEGLVPRFLIIEYSGLRPAAIDEGGEPPPPELVQTLTNLAVAVLQMQQSNYTYNLQLNHDAASMLKAFDRECDDRINSSDDEATRELWNRAHLKALRVAGLLSINTQRASVVTGIEAEWALSLVRRDVVTISAKFEQGDVGQQSDNRTLDDLKRVIVAFYRGDAADLAEKYAGRIPHEAFQRMQRERVVPYAYLQRRTASLSSFKTQRNGSTEGLKRMLTTLLDTDDLRLVPRDKMHERYGIATMGYVLQTQ